MGALALRGHSKQVSLLPNTADVHRGPTERHRQVPVRQRRVQHVEQAGIFQGKAPGDPGILRVVDHQAALQAGGAGGRPREDLGGKAQLTRVGHVLGVVDNEQLAAGEGQGDVERPRLRPRPAVGNRDHLEAGGQRDLREGGDGAGVVRLDDELQVELGRRVVAVLCSNLTQKG